LYVLRAFVRFEIPTPFGIRIRSSPAKFSGKLGRCPSSEAHRDRIVLVFLQDDLPLRIDLEYRLER